MRVNLYAYRRTTFDIDLLVRESDAQRWRRFFENEGYAIFHATANFIRMRFAADPAAALPVDFMLADEETFRRIFERSHRSEIGDGCEMQIPSALHLIAMKLHALRSPHRLADGLDLQDVTHLIKTAKVDTAGREFIEILERYATDTVRERIFRALEEESRP